MLTKNTKIILSIIILASVTAIYFYGRSFWVPVYQKITGKKTIAEVVLTYGPDARERLRPYFESSGVSYPPKKVILLGIKSTSQLEMWAEAETGPVFVRSYTIRALSGVSGPKLRQGDRQVPEGLYKIEGLNPNSSYHLSMKLNYPNNFDLKYATEDGRSKPGTNIFIHGKAVSIGCLAMGDTVIEELFVLAADVGSTNIEVAIAPTDPRLMLLSTSIQPNWVSLLYKQLNIHFSKYKRNEN